MKKRISRGMLAVVLGGILIVGSAWGYGEQEGRKARSGQREMGPQKGLNLTEEQREEMKTLRVSFMKEMTPLKNEIGVKMAELKAASTGDNVDVKAVNKLIDTMSALKANMAKKQFANKQKVRALLTDEQKVMFDARAGKGHRGGQRKGMRQGREGRQGKFHKGMKERRGAGQGQRGEGRDLGLGEKECDSDIQG